MSQVLVSVCLKDVGCGCPSLLVLAASLGTIVVSPDIGVSGSSGSGIRASFVRSSYHLFLWYSVPSTNTP